MENTFHLQKGETLSPEEDCKIWLKASEATSKLDLVLMILSSLLIQDKCVGHQCSHNLKVPFTSQSIS